VSDQVQLPEQMELSRQAVSGRNRVPVALYPHQVRAFSGLWQQRVFFGLWRQEPACAVGSDPELGVAERYAEQQESLW
jgi:hypothetical protein